MQQITLTNDLTNYDKSRTLLNLMTSLWFVKAKAKVDKSSNTARKKKWAKLDPFEMNILIPVTTKGKYYLIDRPAGLLLAHTPVPYLTWPRFFAWLKKTNPPGTAPNSAIQTLIDNGITIEGVEAALADSTTWDGEPTAWKTIDENNDDVILVTGPPLSDKDIVNLIQTQLFQNFHFQSAVYTYNTPAEMDKPVYYTAALALKDEAFPEKTRSKTLYVVNLGQFMPSADDSESDDDTDDTETGNAEEGSPSQEDQNTNESGSETESDSTPTA